MRAGKVSREHVKQALAKRKESENPRRRPAQPRIHHPQELTWARRVQVVGVIRSIAAWVEGSFTIVADYLPKRDEGTLFPLPQVLVELIVTEQDRARFERALDGGSAVFVKTADFDEVWRRLGLNEDAEAIAVEIDGVKNSMAVATASGRDTFNVYKLLHALATLGVLARADQPQVTLEVSLDDFAAAGVADAADVWASPEAELTDADFEEPAPEFALDDAEPIVQLPSYADEAAIAPTLSAWDDADDVPLDLSLDPTATLPTPKMPVWDGSPPPINTRVAGAPESEPQWGFDEAQLETARAAAAPSNPGKRNSATPAKKPGRYGLLVALMLIAILGAAGYYGFLWWQGRQETATPRSDREPRSSACSFHYERGGCCAGRNRQRRVFSAVDCFGSAHGKRGHGNDVNGSRGGHPGGRFSGHGVRRAVHPGASARDGAKQCTRRRCRAVWRRTRAAGQHGA